MKILIYAGTFIKNQDGVARATYRLVQTLLNQNIQVLVLAPKATPQNRPGLTIYEVPSVPCPLYKDYHMAIPNGKIIRWIKGFKPDIIHIATPDFIGIQILQFAKIAHIPVVSIHHTDFCEYLPYYNLSFLQEFFWDVFTKFYNFTERTFAPTEEIKKKLESRGVKHVSVWSRGIDREAFHPKFRSELLRTRWNAKNKKVIMYVGRFVWYKDLRIVYKVYQRFQDRIDKDIVFVMVGSGPVEPILRKKMPKAKFTGYLQGKSLSKVFASGDIFLFPSTTETFGQVIQEALSSGMPAVVSNKGGCQEIIQKSHGGIIAKAKNVDEFYEAVKELVDNHTTYNQVRSNGLKYAKKRTWEKINLELVRKYRVLATYLKKFQTIAIEKITAMATFFNQFGKVS